MHLTLAPVAVCELCQPCGNKTKPFWALWTPALSDINVQIQPSSGNLWTYKHNRSCSGKQQLLLFASWKLLIRVLRLNNCEPSRRLPCPLRPQVTWSDSMALGCGLKESGSCDQEVTPVTLSSEVSIAETPKKKTLTHCLTCCFYCLIFHNGRPCLWKQKLLLRF